LPFSFLSLAQKRQIKFILVLAAADPADLGLLVPTSLSLLAVGFGF
tara:strand:- start:221 stop:358 length:138 start_codon:yes stop_codon:yes gene_type:complete